ncbi:DsbA family oxidoreductase [Lentzea flaviverrucosa]|uniref:Predicted dithiol-disulfide isomerase, DsbA family n=1 Tax=Lentzea flaviverrucosa TaxID=200379 RepID=A0A1H9XEA7_9PSEU|nr:DsbA family oxidoreductase [Lentzea flaviverrucosa]RDI21520.1 putative DsbA family dithiol-disulfide isomerase [Lentzea flaviverrucosa]SES44462.1 Predicted dithiol-disulfide isomerase, DsbA family [Lentzea flaviverrucosa]
MQVEFWADVICPWCYIGKARFDKALAGFEHRAEVTVVHRAFELDPNKEGVESVQAMLAAKFGPRAAEMEDSVAQLARDEGLEYRLDREVGNTFDVHRLLHLAGERGVQAEVLDAVLHANFGQARSLFTPESLTEIATEAGLDAADVKTVLEDPAVYADEVRADEQRAREIGVSGVPFVVVAGRLAVAGAQPAELFGRALTQAWEA